MAKTIISDADHKRIAEAIRVAETGTAGEIYCVVARTSDSYFVHAAFMVTAAMVSVSVCVAWIAHLWWYDLDARTIVAAQLMSLALTLALLWLFPGLRIHFVPKGVRFARAHDNAVRQFLSRNIHRTASRTGVLLFLSLAEHYAEVIADAGIDGKAPPETWNRVVATLVDHARAGRIAEGYFAAVADVGAILATHFPARADEPNELDDHIAEI